MSSAAFASWLAAALAVGAWIGVRTSDARHRIDRDLAELVMSLDIDRAAEDAES